MNSSSGAFDRFLRWKKLRRVLRVSVFENGVATEILTGRIADADPESSLVFVVLPEMHGFRTFDVEGSAFSIDSWRLVATKGDSDWLVFDEDLTISDGFFERDHPSC